MASRGALEQTLEQRQRDTTLFFFHSFISVFESFLFPREGKRTNRNKSGHLEGLYFPEQRAAFSLRGSEGARKAMPFTTPGFQHQFPSSPREPFSRRRCCTLGWTITCKNAGKKKKERCVAISCGGVKVHVRRGINQFTGYSAGG